MAESDTGLKVATPETPAPPSLGDSVPEAVKTVDAEREGKFREQYRASVAGEREATAKAERDIGHLSEHYQGLLEKERAREGVDMRALKPFDTQQEISKHETNLWEAFGSPGFIAAMIGSAFSAQPMNSALLAGGAAINALNQKNERDFDRAFEAWKANTDLAVKRLAQEDREYQQIVQQANLSMHDKIEQLKLTFAKYGHDRALAALDNGYGAEVEEIISKHETLKTELEKSAFELEKWHGMRAAIDKLSQEPGYEGPEGRLRAITEVTRRIKEAESVRRFTVADMKAARVQEILADPNNKLTVEEVIKQVETESHPDTIKSMEVDRVKELLKEHPDWKLEQAEKHVAAEKRVDTLASDKQKAIRDKMESTPGMTWGRAAQEVNDEMRSKVGELPDDTLRVLAYRVWQGDMSATSGLGWGNVGSTNRAKLNNMITIIGHEKKLSEEQIAKQIAMARASYVGELRGASALGQREALLTAGISAAEYVIPRVLETSRNVSRTEFSDINKILLSGQARTGNTNVVRFGIALETLITDYARAIGGTSSVLTDAAREHARDLLQRAWSQGQVQAGVDQMMLELQSQRVGVLSGEKRYLESFEQSPENANALLRIPVYIRTPEEAAKLPKGQVYVTPDGDSFEAPGHD